VKWPVFGRNPDSECSRSTPAPAPVVKLGFPVDFAIRLGDEVWRLRRRTDRAAVQFGEDGLRGLRDSAERLEGLLADCHISVQDHTGEPYRDGMRLTILHVEGTPGVDESLWIAEMVKPTISVGDIVVREGQVILAAQPPEATAV
jgi:hypothetical protein